MTERRWELERSCAGASARLVVSSSELSAAAISAHLGLEPTATSPQSWERSTEGRHPAEALAPHLELLLGELSERREALLDPAFREAARC